MEQAMAELVRAIDLILRPRSFSATTTPTHTCCFFQWHLYGKSLERGRATEKKVRTEAMRLAKKEKQIRCDENQREGKKEGETRRSLFYNC
jgi:hypothetical protein